MYHYILCFIPRQVLIISELVDNQLLVSPHWDFDSRDQRKILHLVASKNLKKFQFKKSYIFRNFQILINICVN